MSAREDVMREKLKKWLDLILFMGKPEDSSAGHVCHDYKEEMPSAVNPRWAGVVKILLLIAAAILILWQLIQLLL
jgi:hypothetical protein